MIDPLSPVIQKKIMKKTVLIFVNLLFSFGVMQNSFCQTETFDIVQYTPPKNFEKILKQDAVIYSVVDVKSGKFCLIALYRSTVSSGNVEKDFKDKWKELVMTRYAADQNPKTESATTSDGWKTLTGATVVSQDSIQFYVLLTVFSGFGKVVAVLSNLNDETGIATLDAVLENVKPDKTGKVSRPKDNISSESGDANSIVGTWSDQSVSIASYVTPSGTFVGSADVTTMEEYQFKPDKTYLYKFFGSMNGKLYYTETNGTYSTSGKKLSLVPSKRRGGYNGAIKDEGNLLEKPGTLDWYIGPNKWDAGPYLNLHQDGKYYMWSDFKYSYYKKLNAVTTQSPNISAIPDNTSPLATSSAPTQKFGSVMYNTPSGWSIKKYSNAEVLTPADLPKNEFLEIRILPSLNFSGSLEQALQKSYDEAVVMLSASKMHDVNGGDYNMDAAKKSFKGWEYIRGRGGVRAGSGDYPPEYGLELFVVKINNRFERVAIVKSRNNCNLSTYYPDDRINYRKEIERFLFAMQFPDWKETIVKPGVAKGDGITGVWEGITLSVGMVKPGAILGAELKGTYAIFFSNGQAYFGTKFPIEGLDGLDTWIAAETNRRNWGTYMFSNEIGNLKMPYGDIPLRMEKDKLIVTKTNTDHGFIKVPFVDGVKFSGTYVFSSKNIIGEETGKTPKINFTTDGKFTDNGALSVLYHEYIGCLDPTRDPGSGTYEVRHHSVVFNYSDGRKVKIAFVGAGYNKANQSPGTLSLSANEDVMTRQ